ncbi:MAG: YtcA family lipoprotein [Myxococcota bacterium]
MGMRVMQERRIRRRPRAAPLAGLAACVAGCAPSVNILGVYFPGWLVSTVTGVVTSYGIVLWLARRPASRELADSGLFFVSLVLGIALAVWWVFFSSF